jgi:phosphonatase-like hydrolase
MSAPIQLVIFDIAGTLIEDHNEVADSSLIALRNHGISVSESEIKDWKGSSKREVIGHFVARQFGSCRIGQLIDQTYSSFRFLIEKRYAEGGVVPIAGAAETVAWLRERQIKIATTTGFYRELRDAILRAAGWEHTFDANVCSDDVAHGRPAPDMIHRAMELTGVIDSARVLNVGDTPLHLQSASNAKVGMSIGVLTCHHDQERLQREPHTKLISSVADLPGLLNAVEVNTRAGTIRG